MATNFELVESGEIVRKVLSAIGREPRLKYNDMFDFEEGKHYEVYADIELVGAYVEENEIIIVGRIKESIIHEDIIDNESINKGLCDGVMNSILKVEPGISKMVKRAPSVNGITILLYKTEDLLVSFEYSYLESDLLRWSRDAP